MKRQLLDEASRARPKALRHDHPVGAHRHVAEVSERAGLFSQRDLQVGCLEAVLTFRTRFPRHAATLGVQVCRPIIRPNCAFVVLGAEQHVGA